MNNPFQLYASIPRIITRALLAWAGLCVSSPDAPALSELGSWPAYPAISVEDVQVRQDLAYLAAGQRGVGIAAVAKGREPELLSTFGLDGSAHALAVEWPYVYVAADTAGLVIVDVTDPRNPVELGRYKTAVPALHVCVHGSTAYLGGNLATVDVIDVSNPSVPKHLSQYAARGRTGRMQVTGTWGFLIAGSRIDVLDLRNRSKLAAVRSIQLDRTTPTDIRLQNDLLLAAFAGTQAGLYAIDVAQPNTPVALSRVLTGSAVGTFPTSLGASGSTVLLASEHGSVRVIDVGQPRSLRELGIVTVPNQAVPAHLAVDQGRAFLACREHGLRILDVATPSAPAFAAGLDGSWSIGGIAILEGYAVLADLVNGIQVLDVRDARQPRRVGMLPITLENGRMEISGAMAYLANGKFGLQVLDLNSPEQPTLQAVHAVPSMAVDVRIADSRAYVACGYDGVLVLDLGDPIRPRELGRYDTPGFAYRLALRDHLLYVADAGGGLLILDVADPSSPGRVGGTEVANPARSSVHGVSLHGNRLYTLHDNPPEWIQSFDLADPLRPALTASHNLDFSGVLHDHVATPEGVVVGYSGGLAVLDTSRGAENGDPWTRLPITSGVRAVRSAGGRIYAGGTFGLLLLGDAYVPPRPRITRRGSETFVSWTVASEPSALVLTTSLHASPPFLRLANDSGSLPGREFTVRIPTDGAAGFLFTTRNSR